MFDYEHPVLFLNPADLLFAPFKDRPTAQQLIAVSRILDIENMHRLKAPYWEQRLTQVCKSVFKEVSFTFYELVNTLDAYGFSPEISCLSAGISPASINNGTHRLGYSIVNYKSNRFIPVRAGFSLWYPVDGIEFYKECGLTGQEIEMLLERYRRAVKDIEHDYILIIDDRHTQNASFSSITDKIGISAVSDALEMVNPEYKESTDYSKFLKKLKDITSIRVMKLPLEAQFLMYRKRRMISREAEEINNIFTEAFGKGWGIVPSCLTESIKIKIFLKIFYDFDAERL